MYPILRKVSFGWYPVLSVEIVHSVGDTHHIVFLSMESQSFNAAINVINISIPSRRNFTYVQCTLSAACFDEADKLSVFFFK